jgi:hypothetical protein
MSAPKREIVASVMVRLTDTEFEALEMHQRPGEDRSETIRRVLVSYVPTLDVMLEYRKPPLFPEWMKQGPVTILQADTTASNLAARGFEVRIANTEPRPLRGLRPEDVIDQELRESAEKEEEGDA